MCYGMPYSAMDRGYLIDRDVEEIYVPNTVYGVGGGGKEAVLQMIEQDWFAIEMMRSQRGTTNVYLVDTTIDEQRINDRIERRQRELNEIRDEMRESLSGQQIGGINLEPVEVTKGLKTDRASSLTGEGSVPAILEATAIDHWWLERKDLIEPGTNDLYDFSKGACRCRAIGKAFHYKALAEGDGRGYELNYTLPGDDDKVAIFAGLGGGTGSGLIIDIARRLYDQNEARRTTLFATLPTRKEQVKERANAFAALSELEYQALAEEEDIFDNIVLFPLQPLDPDIAVQDRELVELDRALSYALIGYYNAGHYDDGVNQAPSYAPFTMALPQVFRYDIDGIIEAKDNAIETINRKIAALNAEREIYDRVQQYVDRTYPSRGPTELKRDDEEQLKRRIEFMRELVELPLFEELEFASARETGGKILNTVYDADEDEGETYADSSLEVAFAENDLEDLLGRELRFFFNFEYKDVDVGSELDELDELDDESIEHVVLAETARLQEKYEALRAVREIPSSSGGNEAVRHLLQFLLSSSPGTDESARVNAVEKHKDQLLDDIQATRRTLDDVTEDIEAELHVQDNVVQDEKDNWERAVADDLQTYAELSELDIEDDLQALRNALEGFAAELQQGRTPPSGEQIESRLNRLRESLADVDAINFANEYEQIVQEVNHAKQLRRDWNRLLDARDRGLTEKVNPFSDTPDPDSAKKELRATIVNLSEKVFTTSHIGPNETELTIEVTYDPRADGELLDRIRSKRTETREAIVDEFERRLDRIATEEGDGTYAASDVEAVRERVTGIQSRADLDRERPNLVSFVEETYKETASEELPELEARRDELQSELDDLETRRQTFDDVLEIYKDLRDRHATFTDKHEAFNEDINRQAERFGTRAFAEYQPNQHYIHRYMPQDTRRAIEKRSLAQTDLFQRDWDQNERGRIQDFTTEIVKRRAAAPNYIGLRERDFGNRDFDFTGTRIHVAKISEALDSSGNDKAKLWLEDLSVRDQLGTNYYLDESGQARRMFEQWGTRNGGPWDVALTFFIQGLGFLDNLRDVVENRGYRDGYETRKREIHNVALHHAYGLERGFYVRRHRFVDPSTPGERDLFLDADAASITRELCERLERVPIRDEVGVEHGPPTPTTYRDEPAHGDPSPAAADGDGAGAPTGAPSDGPALDGDPSASGPRPGADGSVENGPGQQPPSNGETAPTDSDGADSAESDSPDPSKSEGPAPIDADSADSSEPSSAEAADAEGPDPTEPPSADPDGTDGDDRQEPP